MLNTSRFVRTLLLMFLASGAILAQDDKSTISTPAAPAATTQNRLPKFTDGAGTLGDSALFEFNGNIGWGTTTPAHPLTVRRNGASLGVHSIGELFVDRDDRTRSASLTVGTAGTLKWIFGMPFGTDGFQVYDLLANQTRLFVHPDSGNIGVGTTAPGFPLTVAGVINSTSGGFRFPDGTVQTTAATGSGGGGVTGGGTTGTVPLWSGSTALGDSAIVQANGHVGIGTVNPTETLQVAGIIQSAIGGFKFPDGTLQTTAAVSSSINRVIRGVISFSGNNYDVSQNFSPNIDPSKSVVLLSEAIREPGNGNGINGSFAALLVSLDSNTIRVSLSVGFTNPGLAPFRVSYQIIEYKYANQ